MTDMPGMLLPPLDDEDSYQDSSGTKEDNSGDGVLPQEIKDRFSKVRSLLREQASTKDEDSAAELKRKQQAAALETARAVQEEVARLQNGIAELEAIYAMQQRQRELQLLQGGEVESDSEDDEEDEQLGIQPANNNNDIVNNNGIVFPALPSMVNAVEPDSDSDTRHGENGRNGNEEGESRGVVATKDIHCDA